MRDVKEPGRRQSGDLDGDLAADRAFRGAVGNISRRAAVVAPCEVSRKDLERIENAS